MPHPIHLFTTASYLVLFSSIPALSGEIAVNSTIRAVTVYTNSANITRVAEAEIPAGASLIVFRGLPETIDPSSIRISGEALTSLSFGSIETRVTPVDQLQSDTATDAKIKLLFKERGNLLAAVDALNAEIAMVKTVSQADFKNDVKNWHTAFELVRVTIENADAKRREFETQIQEITLQIAAIEASATPKIPTPHITIDALITTDAATATHAKISISYRVHNALWRPVYDAFLDTKKNSVEIVRRIEVKQSTGEDWNNVALSASTTKNSWNTFAPKIDSLFVNIFDPSTPMRSYALAASPSAANGALEQKSRSLVTDATQPLIAAHESSASINFSNFGVTFDIPAKISAASDGSPHSFLLGSQTTPANLTVRVVPSIDTTAFLETNIFNKSDAPLLPGPVSLFRDNAFSGKANMPEAAASETFNLSFGPDDSVKVTHIPISILKSDPTWYAHSSKDVLDFNTTIKNLHQIPIKVIVNDRIPIAGNDAIIIESFPETTPPTAKDIDGKAGVYAWNFELAPSESKSIRLAYKISWPADKTITPPQ